MNTSPVTAYTRPCVFANTASASGAPVWFLCNNKVVSIKRMSLGAVSAFRKVSERATSLAVFVSGDQFHMSWIYTARGFAKMVNLQFWRNWAVNKFPRKTMRWACLIVPPKFSITIFVNACRPDPAFSVVVDFFSEAFGKDLKGVRHGLG